MSEEIKETPEVQEKVFPMNTFVAALKGGEVDAGLLEFLSYVTQSDVSADLAPVAAGLTKGYIYEQEPKLTGASEGDLAGLGAKIKLTPLAGEELSQAQAALNALVELQAENAALKAEVEKANAAQAEAEAKVDGLQAKVKVAEDQNAAGEQKVTLAATKLDDMIKKLNDLQAEVGKVKSQGVVVAGAAGGGDAAAPADGGSGDAPATGGEPEDGFGLGSNPFADADW